MVRLFQRDLVDLAATLLAVSAQRTTTRERVELLANEAGGMPANTVAWLKA